MDSKPRNFMNRPGKHPADVSKLAQVERLIRKNRDAYERLGRQFAALWLSESKPYALDWTLGRYTNAVNECEVLLRKAGGCPRWPPPLASPCRRQTNLDSLHPNRYSAACARPRARRRR